MSIFVYVYIYMCVYLFEYRCMYINKYIFYTFIHTPKYICVTYIYLVRSENKFR